MFENPNTGAIKDAPVGFPHHYLGGGIIGSGQ
jgi:hypothetical protein